MHPSTPLPAPPSALSLSRQLFQAEPPSEPHFIYQLSAQKQDSRDTFVLEFGIHCLKQVGDLFFNKYKEKIKNIQLPRGSHCCPCAKGQQNGRHEMQVACGSVFSFFLK